MPLVERSALVMYSPAQMFALVNDVARYPQFLPWCVEASVQEVTAQERLATLKVARGLLRTSFTTRNILQGDQEISMHLAEGAFRHLTGRWSFTAIANRGSRIDLKVDFEFKSSLTAAAFGSVFESVCTTMVDAFAARARQVYG